MPAPDSTGQPLLVVVGRSARRVDGESVRIARDVLCAGAPAKLTFPDGPEEVERALARRGRRRPVLVGDDRMLLQAVRVLGRRHELAGVPLAIVPVGTPESLVLAGALGLPLDAVRAARAVLDGAERAQDALVDDSGAVVLGGVSIPGGAVPREPDGTGLPGVPGPAAGEDAPRGGAGLLAPEEPVPGELAPGEAEELRDGAHQPWWSPAARTARTALATLLAGPAARQQLPACTRLRVEADSVLLTDLDRSVDRVTVCLTDGLAEVAVRPRAAHDGAPEPLRARARTVMVTGPDFRYRADGLLAGPVRRRTWTVREGAWRLVVPRY
ncbi:hypothetical protein ACFP1Z_05175 [Streptomyces gamaensis]|uniref:Diacylglycerol kinase n=1 Tax=Streptomyces gamaensis TaxID=1763542 RepID=A0ABW0YSP1_9ACTN